MGKKNFEKYYQAWELRQKGKKLREIAKIMGYDSVEWVRVMIKHFDFRLKNRFYRLPKEYRVLAEKIFRKKQ